MHLTFRSLPHLPAVQNNIATGKTSRKLTAAQHIPKPRHADLHSSRPCGRDEGRKEGKGSAFSSNPLRSTSPSTLSHVSILYYALNPDYLDSCSRHWQRVHLLDPFSHAASCRSNPCFHSLLPQPELTSPLAAPAPSWATRSRASQPEPKLPSLWLGAFSASNLFASLTQALSFLAPLCHHSSLPRQRPEQALLVTTPPPGYVSRCVITPLLFLRLYLFYLSYSPEHTLSRRLRPRLLPSSPAILSTCSFFKQLTPLHIVDSSVGHLLHRHLVRIHLNHIIPSHSQISPRLLQHSSDI